MRKRSWVNPKFLEWAYQDAPMPSKDVLRDAFRLWHLNYPFFWVDLDLMPFVGPKIQSDWLRRARESLFLTLDFVAKEMKVSKGTYAKFEKCERAQTIKLGSLIKAAQAMNCELVYAIRPKSSQIFSEVIWSKIIARAKDNVRVRNAPDGKMAWSLAGVAHKLMNDTHFRQDMGWAEKRPNPRSRGR